MKGGYFSAVYWAGEGAEAREVRRDFFLPDVPAVRREILRLGGTPVVFRRRLH